MERKGKEEGEEGEEEGGGETKERRQKRGDKREETKERREKRKRRESPPFGRGEDAFSVRHLPTRQGDTVRVFAATRASAECAFALRFAAGAVRVCVFVRPPFPTMPRL